MTSRPEGYIPAAGHDWLLPLYDPILRFVFRDASLRQAILAGAQIGPRCRVLDVGCGTGTQAVLVKQAHPDAEVIGVDGDARALALARRKVARAGVDIALDEALATALPYADSRFDRVISSLVFHHLLEADKRRALAEIRRVLAPGGAFLLADFGAPVTWLEKIGGHLVMQGEHARLHFEGGVPALLRDAGFRDVEEVGQHSAGIGRVWLWRARE